MHRFKVSACNYELEKLSAWDEFVKKIETLCENAAAADTKIVVLPEYFSLELCSLLTSLSLTDQFEKLQQFLAPLQQLFIRLAKQYHLYIAAGTFPVKTQLRYYNRCYFFYPTGNYDFQDKCYLIRYEQSIGLIQPGESIKVFQTEFGNIAIQICYDVELPMLTQQYMQYPVDLILVPSCTETKSGLNRVRICAQARAIEQQCYVVQSGLMGSADYCEFININVAQAGVYCPSDGELPNNGLILDTSFSKAGIYTTEIDLTKIYHIREQGAVSNFNDLQQITSHKLEMIHAK